MCGARGGGNQGGSGASMIGEFTLSIGDVLTLVVGQMGINESYSRTYIAGGGGGGTFVTLNGFSTTNHRWWWWWFWF